MTRISNCDTTRIRHFLMERQPVSGLSFIQKLQYPRVIAVPIRENPWCCSYENPWFCSYMD